LSFRCDGVVSYLARQAGEHLLAARARLTFLPPLLPPPLTPSSPTLGELRVSDRASLPDQLCLSEFCCLCRIRSTLLSLSTWRTLNSTTETTTWNLKSLRSTRTCFQMHCFRSIYALLYHPAIRRANMAAVPLWSTIDLQSWSAHSSASDTAQNQPAFEAACSIREEIG
jgi:hypothetical protein